jgi:hypothetical protein
MVWNASGLRGSLEICSVIKLRWISRIVRFNDVSKGFCELGDEILLFAKGNGQVLGKETVSSTYLTGYSEWGSDWLSLEPSKNLYDLSQLGRTYETGPFVELKLWESLEEKTVERISIARICLGLL